MCVRFEEQQLFPNIHYMNCIYDLTFFHVRKLILWSFPLVQSLPSYRPITLKITSPVSYWIDLRPRKIFGVAFFLGSEAGVSSFT